MTKYTPGPWKAGPVFQKEGRALFVTDETKPGKWRKRLDDKSGVFAEDDARLIAAAPDLLAALEGCLRGLYIAMDRAEGDCFGVAHNDVMDTIDSARAAIAKAKGETGA